MPRKNVSSGVPKEKKPRVKRTYRDWERLAALVICDERGPSEAARQTKIPEATIRSWAAGWRDPGTASMYEQARGQLADVFEKTAWECLHQARETLGKADFKDAIRGAGLSTDKMLLLRGKPTNITQNANTNATLDPWAALLDAATDAELPALLAIMNRAGNGKPTVPGEGESGAAAVEPVTVHATVLARAESGS